MRTWQWAYGFKIQHEKVPVHGILYNVAILKIFTNSRENIFYGVLYLLKLQTSTYNINKIWSSPQVFYCEIFETFLNSYYMEHCWWLPAYAEY